MHRIRQATDNYVVFDSAIVYGRRFDVRIVALFRNSTTSIITLGWIKYTANLKF
ncbi:hypothetical protein GNF10_21830 [Nostoc sp. UCD121]|uniref:hypothetical protein n=1 Tax=unclassified Nostoc TaxID=2593658 RepID=UPI0016261E29|nr:MULTISPECIES: hypothetical protein [unclassified Nostoc]MBC1224217.1 hypothetical protein [Nostoc sp. UCD120]MBC1278532.1 hypothetical protein [Nostoc sp. UCD121]MBC1299273.1 hypothetical protein [Nostoc sp. UCD122]